MYTTRDMAWLLIGAILGSVLALITVWMLLWLWVPDDCLVLVGPKGWQIVDQARFAQGFAPVFN